MNKPIKTKEEEQIVDTPEISETQEGTHIPDDIDYDSLKEMGIVINQFIERKEAENDKG